MTCRQLSIPVQALSLVVLLAGCDSDRTRTPLSPTPTPVAPAPPAPAIQGGTLSGVVFELTAAGRVPIAGVDVYCDACGPQGHTGAMTGSDGEYVLPGAQPGANLLLVARQGYALARADWTNPNPTPLGWLGGMYAPVNGDTRFDIELVRR